jgi:hypothetical protein
MTAAIGRLRRGLICLEEDMDAEQLQGTADEKANDA